MSKTCLILGFVLQVGVALSQTYRSTNQIPVMDIQGDTLSNAWAGGLETPKYGTTDLNADGLLDLITFDDKGNRFVPYINEGFTDSISYRFAPEYYQVFENCECEEWAVMADANCDGLEDIFCRTFSSDVTVYYQTQRDGNPSFELAIDELRAISGRNNVILTIPSTDVPAIVDLDYDGDMDFLAFETQSNFLTYYRNIALEILGRCDTLVLERETTCWGHFRESDTDNTAFIGVDEEQGCPIPDSIATTQAQSRAVLHAGSTTLLLDLNADSTYDALLGDISFNEVYALYNGGTTEYAFIDSVERNFPVDGISINLPTFPACFYIDVNNDGIRDLVVAANADASFDNTAGNWLYLNEGADNKPQFELTLQDFVQRSQIDVGTYAYPTPIDYNQDGLTDLLVGNRGYYEPSQDLRSALALFQNVGTLENPAFRLVSRDYLSIRSSSNFPILREAADLVPTAGDLTGDGLDDLIIGNVRGTLHYFQTFDPTRVNPFERVTDSLGGIDVGGFSAPHLYDIDDDGDLDLFVGNRSGFIHLYENRGLPDAPAGSPVAPIFELVTEQWGGVKIEDRFGGSFAFAQPFLIDYDADGQVELLVGGTVGWIEIYENVENAMTEPLEFVGYLGDRNFGERASPAAWFIGDNEYPIFVVGTRQGGLQLMTTDTFNIPTDISDNLSTTIPLDVYPNPFDHQIRINLSDPTQRIVRVTLSNTKGQQIQVIQPTRGVSDFSFASKNIPPGIYFLRVATTKNVYHVNLLKQ